MAQGIKRATTVKSKRTGRSATKSPSIEARLRRVERKTENLSRVTKTLLRVIREGKTFLPLESELGDIEAALMRCPSK